MKRRLAWIGPRLRAWGLRLVPWLFFLSVPFGMFGWLFPFVAKTTIGNDYNVFPIGAQIDWFWSIKRGTYPIYMPGFAVGHSTASMTLGQVYHPVSWFSSWMPGYWDGKALEWNTVFRLLLLGIAHLALYRVGRRLSLGRVAAFLSAFPAVYNLRMLDSFRYGASLEGYSGMLIVASTAAFVYLEEASKRSIALLAVSTYMLLVSGHPQWAYLGALAAGVFALLFPWIALALSPEAPVPTVRSLARYVKRLTIGFGSGTLLAMPYALPFYFEYLKTNHARAENPYKWTLGYTDTLQGELCNFLFPMHANVHGAFGGSAFFILVAMFPIAIFAKVRPPKVLWLLYGMLFVTFMFSAGSTGIGGGAIHRFIVEHLPAFQVFRVPGRLVLWIPLFAWPLWAWLSQPANRSSLFAMAVAALMVLGSKWFWGATGLPGTEASTGHTLQGRHFPRHFDDTLLYLFGGTLIAMTFAGAFKRWNRFALPAVLLLTGITSWMCLFEGTWKQRKMPSSTYDQVAKDRRRSPASHADPGEGMEVRGVTEYRKRKIPTDVPLGSISHRVQQLDDDTALWPKLASQRLAPTVYVRDPVVALGPEKVAEKDEVKLVFNTSNRFEFDVTAAKDGYFVLGQPWLDGFVAEVDGVRSPVTQANGLFTATFLPRGHHHVSFRFVSKPFMAGLAVSFLTVWVWFVWAFRRRVHTLRRRIIVAAIFVASGLGLFFGMRAWLYNGPTFHTAFSWQNTPDVATATKPPSAE